MGGESEVRYPKVGDTMTFGEHIGRVVRVETTPEFIKRTRVKVEIDIYLEDKRNETDRKSTKGTKRQKVKSTKRKN